MLIFHAFFLPFQQKTQVISDTHSSSPRSLPPDNTYKSSTSSRRRKSRSRSRDRGRDRDRGGRSRRSRSRSRSRSHSPRRGGGTSGRGGRGSSRDRERERASQKDKERDKERERERKKRGLPEIRKEHLSGKGERGWSLPEGFRPMRVAHPEGITLEKNELCCERKREKA